jgi:3-deoxy-7-phosphoheptulonate synthase
MAVDTLMTSPEVIAHPLPSANALKKQFPLSKTMSNTIAHHRVTIKNIMSGQDPRLLVVVGPCSIHDTEATLVYAKQLANIQQQHRHELLLVMRMYFEKPRTCHGWKGLLYDPDLNGTIHPSKGMVITRSLMQQVARLGLPIATEFLNTVHCHHFSDLVSWVNIGARTCESQLHREMASGLGCAVGVKNRTDGNTTVAINAIQSIQSPHLWSSTDSAGQAAMLQTHGNPASHLILRGGTQPNYDAAQVEQIQQHLQQVQLLPHLMIDCSHGNSNKDHLRQAEVVRDVAHQIQVGTPAIKGVMLESFLQAGRQSIQPHTELNFGQSVTDACLNWQTTSELLKLLGQAVNHRNRP